MPAPPKLIIYTIYKHPSDYPDKFVVRAWSIDQWNRPAPSEKPHAVTDTLQEARASIPPDFIFVAPSVSDDPVIVETWI